MNTLSKVYSKLNSKTELATHKVDLAIVDDYNKAIDKANNFRKKAASSLANLEGDLGSVVIMLEIAEKESNKIKKMAEELGVKNPVNSSKLEAKLKEFRKSLASVKSLKITTE